MPHLQFTYLVQGILYEYLDDFTIVFINDILIFLPYHYKAFWEPKTSISETEKQKIYAKASKCLIHVQGLEFLRQ